MEWTDEGIVLGVRRHGESSAIVELLTRSHGRHLGLVRGGAGTRMRPLLQPGNSVTAVWRARLDEHLGYLRRRGHAAARGHAAGVVACGLWRHPSRLAGAAVAGARSARGHLRDARPHAGRFRRCRRRRGPSDQVRTGDARRTRLRARSGKLRRDRRDHRPDLRLAEIRRRGVAARPASPTATGCCGCRHSCAKARAARTAGRTRTCRTVFG